MGRFWQTVLLKEQYPVFEYLPIETVVKKRQVDYYKALSISDKSGHSTPFIEFMLAVIEESLEELLLNQNTAITAVDRISLFKQKIGNSSFSRKDYLRENKDISSATASRDLKEAVEKRALKKSGDRNITIYKFL